MLFLELSDVYSEDNILRVDVDAKDSAIFQSE